MDLKEIISVGSERTDCEILFSCLSAEVIIFLLIFTFFVFVYVYKLWLSDGLYLTETCRSNNRYCYTMAFYFCGYWLNVTC